MATPDKPHGRRERAIALREEKHLTQVQLAKMAGVAQSAVSRFEGGTNIVDAAAAAIAAALGTSAAYLNGETDDPSPTLQIADDPLTLDAALLRAPWRTCWRAPSASRGRSPASTWPRSHGSTRRRLCGARSSP